MVGYGVCEIIPYKDFKEKIRITKELSKQHFECIDLEGCLLVNIENKEVKQTWQC